jgi:hypothetical protein
LISIVCQSQNVPTKEDSAMVDSLKILFDQVVREWDPEAEPWTFIEFRVDKLNMMIKYGQKSIHPFLAEYERRIQFENDGHKTDTLDMAINSGGRTSIKLFHDPNEHLLIMEDRFGRYFFDLKSNNYNEKLFEFEPYENREYIGLIDGTEYPLKYEPKDE